jgi:hypothetical protein
MPRFVLLSIAALSLAACAVPSQSPDPLPDPAEADECGASGLQQFVGRDSSVLAATTFLAPVHIIRPGEAVTMDFNPARLNFELDSDERIVRVYCG